MQSVWSTETTMIPAPPIISRAEWGARSPTQALRPFTPTGALVHHTAGANGVFSYEEECRLTRAMQQQHIAQGWHDLGVHAVVYQSGRIFAGRPLDIRGVHSPAANAWALSAEHQGNFTDQEPTQAQWDASVWLFAWMAQEAGFGSNRIYGHRDWTATACPGNAFYGRLDEYRSDVANFSSTTTADVVDDEETQMDALELHKAGSTVMVPFRGVNVGNPARGSKALKYGGWLKLRAASQPLRATYAMKLAWSNGILEISSGRFDGGGDISFPYEVDIWGAVQANAARAGYDPNAFYAGHFIITLEVDAWVWIDTYQTLP